MTAIAYRAGVLAADNQTSGEDFRRGTAAKIARSPKGTIGAAAGLAGTTGQFRRWIENGHVDQWIEDGFRVKLPIDADRNQFGAIVVTAAGRVIAIDYRGYPVEIDAPFHVEGSAEQILLGAMAAGASAEEAVRIAIQYDTGCGGEVQVERLLTPYPGPSAEYIGNVQQIDPADWPVHERLMASIKTSERITLDIAGANERTTGWGNNLFLQTRKHPREDGELVERPGLIGQTWGANGTEEIERIIAEGNRYSLLTLPAWHPGALVTIWPDGEVKIDPDPEE